MNHVRSAPHKVFVRAAFLRVAYYLGIFTFFAVCLDAETNRPKFEPEANSITGASAIAQNLVFYDDFQRQLNPAWTWENEDASRWQINSNGWLEITGGDASRALGAAQLNLLWMPAPQAEWTITTRLETQPLFDYQQAGLLLFDEAGRYLALSRGYCQECVLGGNGIFLEHNLTGERVRLAFPTEATDMYLMLIQTPDSIGAFYALQTGPWQSVANLQNSLPFERVGLSVTNDSRWEEGYDVIGKFDFFEIRPSFHQTPPPLPTYFQQTGNF